MSIEMLNLSDKAKGCLENKKINTIEELVKIDLEQLNKICFMNQNTVNEIVEACKKRGLFLETGVIDKDKFFRGELEEYDDEKVFTFNVKLGDEEFPVFTAYYDEDDVRYFLGEGDKKLISLLENNHFSDYVLDQEGGSLSVPGDINYTLEEFLEENLPEDVSKYFLIEYIRKSFKNLEAYKNDNYSSLYQYISKFLETKHFDYVQFVKEYWKKIYESGTDIDIDDCKKQMIRPVLFVKNEIKELKKSNPSSKKINVLESMLKELENFPEVCERLINETLFDDDQIEYYIGEANEENDIIAEFIVGYNIEEKIKSVDMTLDELFNLLPSKYVDEEFYDKFDELKKNEDVLFVSSFVKLAKKICKKADGKPYDTIEIINYLNSKASTKLSGFVRSFDDIDQYGLDGNSDDDINNFVRRRNKI